MKLRTIVGAAGALASAANACPLCHTQTGEQVRAALFGRDFWLHVTATILPFAIFAMITGLIYFGPRQGKPRVGNSSRARTKDGDAS